MLWKLLRDVAYGSVSGLHLAPFASSLLFLVSGLICRVLKCFFAIFVQMVPRDWFRGGLLKDLAYYRPFSVDS
jgi:predicted membrane metal-binding protein